MAIEQKAEPCVSVKHGPMEELDLRTSQIRKFVVSQQNQKSYRGTLCEYEDSVDRKVVSKDMAIEKKSDSCVSVKHGSMEEYLVSSSLTGELSYKQSDEAFEFEALSDWDVSDINDLEVSKSTSEAYFPTRLKLEEVAWDNVTAWDSKNGNLVKALKNNLLGAWSLM